MNKITRLVVLLAALFAVVARPDLAEAQARGTVTGVVLDEVTNQPLANVQIFVPGTSLGTLTNAQGRFIIVNAPAGPLEIRANRLGYASATQRVTLAAGETATADFTLTPSAVALDEIVVTGTAGAVQRRAQPAVVASVDAAEVIERGVVSSVQDVLTARVPGVTVTSSSGSSGTSQQIRIRGASSISLSNEPLVFIDGVRANSSASTLAGAGGQANSRLFDINPEDIESIEVVKGPAAATLYGADASAGVIQIITKKGRTGANRFTQQLSVEYNSIDPNFTPDPNAGTCSASMVAPNSGRVLCEGQPVGTVVFDNPLVRTNAFRTGELRSISYSGRGGGENYGYYFSLNNDDELGTLPSNEFLRRSARVNFNFIPTPKLAFDAGFGVYNTETDIPQNDNNVYGFLGGGYLGRPTNVRRNADGDVIGGFYVTTRGVEAISAIEATYTTLRFTPTLQASYTPTDWFVNRLTIGADVSNSDITQFFPKNDQIWYQGDTNTGSLEENRLRQDIFTLDYLGTIRTNLTDAISSNLSFGTQVIVDRYDRVTGDGVGFVTNTNRDIGAAAQISASQLYEEDRSIGLLAQWDVGFSDRLFVQLGARLDQNSSFGANTEPFFLPKVGVSYVISEEGFWEPIANAFPTVRLRAAYGTTGRSPTPGASLETYDPRPYAIITGGSAAGVIPENPGNLALKPERGTEFEAGVDAGFFQDRFGLEVTYFNKVTTDLLLRRPIPPSSGFTSNPFVNIGEVVNRGLEYALRGTLVNTPNVVWEARVAGSTLHNELVDLGDVEPFGSFNRFTVGRPLGAFVTRRIRGPNAAGTALVVSDTLEYIGNVLPTNEGNFGTTVTLFRNLQLTGQLDWKSGHHVYNNTAQFRDRQFRNSEVGVRCVDVLGQQECDRRFGPFVSEADGSAVSMNLVDEEYVESADFVRLREIAATIGLPTAWTSRFGAESVSLTVGGRNLGLWTEYSGSDPEVISAATAGFSRSDFLTVPQPRRFVVRANLTF